ncbi:MAG: cell division protein FtsQ/DivIB [Elusimicrobiota bacterium]|nr:cell division protein FtsQ/DivIB [Elusimicrobiota bacterium]
MSSHRRRYRVVTRPQTRARRVRAAAVVGALGALTLVAVAVVKHLAASLPRMELAQALTRPGDAFVEAPEPLRGPAQAVADKHGGSPAERAEAVRAAFPSVAKVEVRRSWTEKRATLVLTPRAPVAAATRHGRDAGFLGEDGEVFVAPEGLYALKGPVVEVGDAPASELKAVAAEWGRLAAPGALPAPLARFARRSAEDGWTAELEDGTSVAWGRLDYTADKLARLAEALADARRREDVPYSADLRWFEDGKVLLRPTARLGAVK